jgi:hypothetical protein
MTTYRAHDVGVEVRYRLPDRFLWTRETARQHRKGLLVQLAGTAPGSVIVLDLAGVEAFDFSYANEFFGRTILELPSEHPGRLLLVENLTEYTRENLEQALEGLNLAVLERRGRQLNLIGKVHPADRLTLAALVETKRAVTSSELTEKLGVNVTTINERLTKLAKLGAVLREMSVSPAGREQYRYSLPATS